MDCQGQCGGCRANMYLTGKALELLELLGEYAFLPLGRRDGKPLYITETGEELTNSVLTLSLNGLASLDYSTPLTGFDYSAYASCDSLGSMALTALGQDALEALDINGIEV